MILKRPDLLIFNIFNLLINISPIVLMSNELSFFPVLPRYDVHADRFRIESNSSNSQLSLLILSPTVRLTSRCNSKGAIMSCKNWYDFSGLKIFNESGDSDIRRDSNVLTHTMTQLTISVYTPGIDSFPTVKSQYMIVAWRYTNQPIFKPWNFHWNISWLLRQDISSKTRTWITPTVQFTCST